MIKSLMLCFAVFYLIMTVAMSPVKEKESFDSWKIRKDKERRERGLK